MPRSRSLSSRGRSILLVLGVVAAVLVVSLRGIARAYTDFLWFDSLGLADVWKRQWSVQVVLGVVFGCAFFAIVYGSQRLADRLAPPITPIRSGDEIAARYRELIGERQRGLQRLVSALFAIIAGLSAAGQWQSWLLFVNGKTVGVRDPLNDVDVGFYMFRLPFLLFGVSWLFAAVLVATIATAMTHFLSGAIRLPGTGAFASRSAKAHVSGMLAVLALIKAADYALSRYTLTLSNNGVVSGALYSDVHASRPALTLLILVAVGTAVAFLVNVPRRGWGIPAISVALWMIIALVAGVVYPAAVQRLKVEAQQSALEAPFIERNIRFTRAAYGLDRVEQRNFDYRPTISDAEVTAAGRDGVEHPTAGPGAHGADVQHDAGEVRLLQVRRSRRGSIRGRREGPPGHHQRP